MLANIAATTMSTLHKAIKQGKVFQNPVQTVQTAESILKLLWKYATSKEERVPKRPLGPFVTDKLIYDTPPPSGLRVTWMGHSSLLIEIDGVRLMTDPVAGKRASFSSFIGPERFFAFPLAIDEWPELDGIILSHDHYDHLDEPTIRQLTKLDTRFYCSTGVGAIIERWGIAHDRITEMDWMDSVKISGLVEMAALPARHFSGRGLHNRNETLWSSFAIRGMKHNIYFGADSGYFEGFKEIGATYGPFDLTMLETGAYDTGWPDIHMGPIKAAQAHRDLRGELMMPIHWGTFNLALHAWRAPIEILIREAQRNKIALFAPQPGQPAEVSGPLVSNWWQ